MVDTDTMTGNGRVRTAAAVPAEITMLTDDWRRMPSPGTQRALQAETGRSYEQLCGPAADGADRIQTYVWMKLRRMLPDLRWEDCADVEIIIGEGDADVDPTQLAASVLSPRSVDSGE